MSAVLEGWYRSGHDDRTFHYAIAASLVLHLLLLFAVPGLREDQSRPEAPGVLVAHIVEPPAAAPATTPPPAPVARPPERPKPRVEPPPKPPPPIRKPSPLAERPVEPAPPPPPVSQPAPPSAEPAPTAPPASVPGPVASTQAAPSAATPAQDDAGSLGDYQKRLAIEAKNYKRYPRVAVDNNWVGTAEVSMVVGANGLIRSITVKTTSGYKVLDDQVVEMARRAKPLVPIPPSLRGREFTVPLTVIFNLTDGG
jgi:protein TonB